MTSGKAHQIEPQNFAVKGGQTMRGRPVLGGPNNRQLPNSGPGAANCLVQTQSVRSIQTPLTKGKGCA